MSYILDALRKSETERKQGEIPDLGSAMQIIHKRRSGGTSLLLWSLVLGLLVNAAVLGWLFWPSANETLASTRSPVVEGAEDRGDTPAQEAPAAVVPQALAAIPQSPEPLLPEARPAQVAGENTTPESRMPETAAAARTEPPPEVSSPRPLPAQTEAGPEPAHASPRSSHSDSGEEVGSNEPVLALEATAADFQRRVPDLTFNSHIFSSSPDSRRVMINNEYLREGASFSGMVVEEITEDGVILNLQGETFSVSVVRDWIAPR